MKNPPIKAFGTDEYQALVALSRDYTLRLHATREPVIMIDPDSPELGPYVSVRVTAYKPEGLNGVLAEWWCKWPTMQVIRRERMRGWQRLYVRDYRTWEASPHFEAADVPTRPCLN